MRIVSRKKTKVEEGTANVFNLIPWPSSPDALQWRRWKSTFLILQRFYRGAPPAGPIFLLGCGPSGTTIIGRILSQHRNVLYLNEPRFVWAKAYPKTDIWSDDSRKGGGRLDLGADIWRPNRNRLIRRMLGLTLSLHGKRRLVDKLPEYSFRTR